MRLQNNILLFFIAVFFAITTLTWIFQNNFPPSWDQASYLEASEILRQTLVQEGLLSFLVNTTTILGSKAPLISILPVPLYLIFWSSSHIALLVNFIFMLVFYLFFYKLIKIILDEKTAIISVLVLSTMPLFYGLARYFFVEFGLMALVVIWIYELLKTQNLTKRKYLFFLGIVSGLGMMMKFHFFLFTAGPALIYFGASWKNFKTKLFDIGNVLIFTIPLILITIPWYSRNIITVLWKAKRASNPALLGDVYYGSSLSFGNLSKSAYDFTNYVVSPYWLLVFLVLGGTYLYKFRKIRFNTLLLSWFLFPFLIFYFGPNKDYRLMLPLLPPFAILISALIAGMFPKKYLIATAVLVFFPVLVYVNTSLFGARLIDKQIAIGPLLFADKKVGDYVSAPKIEAWPIGQTLSFVSNNNKSNLTKKVILASEDEAFNINTLRYFAILEKQPLKLVSASYFQERTDYEVIYNVLKSGDYILMKAGGNPGPVGLNRFNKLILNKLDYGQWENIPNNIKLPDGGYLLIFKSSKL